MIETITKLQANIIKILKEAQFPLVAAVDIAAEINRLQGTSIGALNIAGSIGSLRKKSLVLKRKMYVGPPRIYLYFRPGMPYPVKHCKVYWFLPSRENEVYPLGAEKQLRRDQR